MESDEVGGTTSSAGRPSYVRQDSRSVGGGVDSRFSCNICFEAVQEPVVTQCGHLYCWPCLYRWLEPGMQSEERASLGILHLPPTVNSSRRVCPVCKAPCCVATLVPIYVRADEDHAPLNKISTEDSSVNETEDNRNESVVEGVDETVATNDTGGEPQGDNILGGDGGGDLSTDSTGLRRRFQSSGGSETSIENQVPSRPAANSPRLSPSSPSNAQYQNSWMPPLAQNGNRGSLSRGLLLSFQQATVGAVPPLHRRNGANISDFETHPGATEYLSRLLIMLASFVILCLLLL